VGAAAEILERPVAIQGDRLGALVPDQVLDQLDLVVLTLTAEDSSPRRKLAALERLIRLHVLGHSLLEPGQVLLAGVVGEPA
jgi:hypothetical protein